VRPVVTGTALWTAAGRDAGALLERVAAGIDAISEQPSYPSLGLSSPQSARITELDRDRPAEALLQEVVVQALAVAGDCGPRVGLVVGTCSGSISGPWERWHRANLAGEPGGDPSTEAQSLRQTPADRLSEQLGLRPHCTVSVACASGTAAVAVAAGWISDGLADAVVVAGVDALSLFVHAGFAGLGALSANRPRPFQAVRDGLCLGEGSAALVLEPAARARARGAIVLAELGGVGLSVDGVHMTAPDREGKGAMRAMAAALCEAGLTPERVDLVSVHGTGTAFNDAMEAHALDQLLDGHPVELLLVKQLIGHTLGAAGAIEAVLCVEALRRGWVAPPLVAPDPSLPLPSPAGRPPAVVLSTNSAFGGVNASAVLVGPGVLAAGSQPDHAVRTNPAVRVELLPGESGADRWLEAPERFRRMSRYVRIGVLACRELLEEHGPSEETGVVLISASSCRGADLQYHRRLVERGAASAPRVPFIGTVPGAPAGEVAILWGLRGPCLAFCGDGGLELAVAEAERLVRYGRARRLLALAVEAPGPGLPAWAEATLVERA
jgi:3-oxoacyl-[acyl-carrier-protein] synthase II